MKNINLFKQIATIATKTNTEIFVVGGFVRDQLRGIEHKKDIDFVVLNGGISFAKAFAEAMGEEVGTLIEFEDFDTARFVFTEEETITPEHGEPYIKKHVLMEVEFAGARSEAYQLHSRKPAVKPATLEEDLSRRDFTVNAMARKVEVNGELGEIIDPFNGQIDLENKILRTPLSPDETFSEDPLRMLRAARFAAQLRFNLDDKTYAAIYENKDRLKIVSAERIQEEMMKLMKTDIPSIGLRILCDTKLISEFLPEVLELGGVEEVKGYSHKDNLSHTFAVVDNIAEYSKKPLLRFAGLMHDIAKPQTKQFVPGRGWTFDMHEHLGKKMTKDIFRRLKMSVDDTKYVMKLVRWHLQPIALMDEGITDSAVRRLIVNLGDDLEDLLILCRADITTGNQKKKERRLRNYDKLEQRIAEILEKDKLRAFQSPVRGEEIMELCGLKPGPTVGKIKKALEEAILDGVIPNEYEATKEYFLNIKDEYLKGVLDWERK